MYKTNLMIHMYYRLQTTIVWLSASYPNICLQYDKQLYKCPDFDDSCSKLTHDKKIKLDEIDFKLIQEYTQDSRRSLRKIAKKIGVAVTTVQEHTRKLERLGIIKGYSAIVDYEKLGYELTSISEVSVSKGKVVEVEETLAKFPETVAVYDVSGSTDIISIARFKTKEQLNKHIKKVLAIPFIEQTNTHLVLATVKERNAF